MSARLVALSEEGADIILDRAMVVVGRHPACDARLDSLRISRHHCCMMQESNEIVVRDLGSTNGIRINGHRVEMGRLRPGDELSIAHIRYRYEIGHDQDHDQTMADPATRTPQTAPSGSSNGMGPRPASPPLESDFRDDEFPVNRLDHSQSNHLGENSLAAAVRKLLPSEMADNCRIQVIVQMNGEKETTGDPSGFPLAGVKTPRDLAE